MMTVRRSARLTIPGPPAVRLIGANGNVAQLLRDPIGYMGNLFSMYGPVASLAYGRPTRVISPFPFSPGTVFTYGPTLLRQITTQHDVFHGQPASGPMYPLEDVTPRTEPLRYWGTGLFNVNGETHRQQRRLMLPAFHRKRVEAYRDTMVADIEAFFANWQLNQRRDLHQDMVNLTRQMATHTLFGADIADAGEHAGRAVEESMGLFVNPLTSLLRFDLPGLPYHRFLNLAAEIKQTMRQIIAQRRANGTGDDVLSMLLEAQDEDGTRLSEEDILGHATLLFAAGHETSANALTWTLLLLSQHPETSAALHDELDSVLHGASPTVEQLPALPLLERVIKESMRLLPPVPWNTRITAEANTLGGFEIPVGTEIIMSIYHTHHMPELYAEPERFNPARWETIEPTTFEYTPFSGGPRMCIGATFAMMEIKLVLATILQRFRFEAPTDLHVDRKVTITLSPKQGLPLIVRPQDRAFNRGAGNIRGNIRSMVAFE